MDDLAIRGGMEVEGAGGEPRVAEMAVGGGRISAVGRAADGGARRTMRPRASSQSALGVVSNLGGPTRNLWVLLLSGHTVDGGFADHRLFHASRVLF